MANPWARDRATFFYLSFGLIGLVVIALGFGVTYILPMARRTFSAPWFVHLHGASALAWVLLFIAQSALVRTVRTGVHRRLGLAALPLATLVWVSGIATSVWAATRDLPELGTAAGSSVVGTITGLTLYLLLVMAAVLTRRKPDWHKRLVMLATIQVLWPAFFRLRHLLPAVPYPDVSFALVLAYLPILVAGVRDWRRYGKVVEQALEFVFFDQGPLRRFGQWIYPLLA
jgi:hypothetical protein